MPLKQMSVDEFIAFLKKQQGDQTDKDFALSIGVTPQYLCDVYKGRRTPGDTIAGALGATRSLVYTLNQTKGEE